MEKRNENKEEKVSNRIEFEHLYNSPAPWTGMPKGNEFKTYLLSKKESGKTKDLNESEKKCLANLEDYLKEHSEEQEGCIDYDESAIDWTRLKTNYDVAFYLSFPDFFLSEANKNIRHFVLNKFEEGSVSSIVKYANEQIKKLENKSLDEKNKDEKKEENNEENNEENKSSEKEESQGNKESVSERFSSFSKKDIEDYEKQSEKVSVQKDDENKEKQSKVDEIDQSMIDEAEKLADSREME